MLFSNDCIAENNTHLLFRMNLLQDRSSNMIVCKDYWMSRTATQAFKLCASCPRPPHIDANYVISCTKHNQ